MEWTSIYKTNIEIIDKQHKTLFDVITKIKKLPVNKDNRQEVIKVFNFLEKYILIHFTTEEKYMKSIGYLNYEEHKKIHSEFINKFFKIKKQVEHEQDFDHIQLFYFLIKWLQQHIAIEDKKYANYQSIGK